jgi:hypothetical protein
MNPVLCILSNCLIYLYDLESQNFKVPSFDPEIKYPSDGENLIKFTVSLCLRNCFKHFHELVSHKQID